ncbi:dihydrolipoamide succinyltransferase [Purpureocillium lavendulum]|uniref:Dihydrolipoamide acetyltransferase component of pyruvate dehydrogenase complex n=1 Tax=Purpureocillium lavendulum TaxID=1247861 RepID=A0AB34G532_9HYPO|nr:dihydrolipoamide succinyltransferase [Purpureocillium lavendulum]
MGLTFVNLTDAPALDASGSRRMRAHVTKTNFAKRRQRIAKQAQVAAEILQPERKQTKAERRSTGLTAPPRLDAAPLILARPTDPSRAIQFLLRKYRALVFPSYPSYRGTAVEGQWSALLISEPALLEASLAIAVRHQPGSSTQDAAWHAYRSVGLINTRLNAVPLDLSDGVIAAVFTLAYSENEAARSAHIHGLARMIKVRRSAGPTTIASWFVEFLLYASISEAVSSSWDHPSQLAVAIGDAGSQAYFTAIGNIALLLHQLRNSLNMLHTEFNWPGVLSWSGTSNGIADVPRSAHLSRISSKATSSNCLSVANALRATSVARSNSLPLQHQSRPTVLASPFSTAAIRHASLNVKVPQMAESISEGTLSQLLKQVGDRVDADEELATIETDKIDVSVNAPEAGVIAQLFVQEGDVVTVGQDLVQLETGIANDGPKMAAATNMTEPPIQSPTQPPAAAAETTVSQPSERAEAQPATVAPEEPRSKATTNKQEQAKEVLPATVPSVKGPARNERVRLDMTALMAWRAKYKDAIAETQGVRLGYMGAFAKAATLAAQQVPRINAGIDTDREIITYRDYVDISIAVSTPKGLVTPVVRDCQAKNVVEIERDARDGKLTMDDLEGGNFSISNPGIFGSMFGTPLINYPQAAVFNINSIKQDVVAVDGKPEIRPMMYITMTYDHRLIDGREAVAFLNIVKGYIEDPAKMLLF